MNSVEFTLKVLPFDDALPQRLAELEGQGWQGVPGAQPVAVYVMFRNVAQPLAANEGRGGISIDDSKVHIIKGG